MPRFRVERSTAEAKSLGGGDDSVLSPEKYCITGAPGGVVVRPRDYYSIDKAKVMLSSPAILRADFVFVKIIEF